LINIAKTKALAVTLGPAGVGIISQLSTLYLTLSTFTSLGNNVGVTRFTASYRASSEKAKIARLLSSVQIVVGAFVLIAVVIGLFFAQQISIWVLNTPNYSFFVRLTFIGLPLIVFYNFFRSFFTGMLQIKTYALTGVCSALIGFAFLVPLVYYFNLSGAVYHIVIFSAVSFAIALYFFIKLKKNFGIEDKTARGIDRPIIKNLMRFGMASLIAGTSVYTAQLAVRSLLLSRNGSYAVGIYQAISVMSGQCIMIILDSIATYSFPKISGLKKAGEIKNEVNQVIRLAILLTVPMITVFLLFKQIIIVLFYSSKFLEASQLIGLQMAGDFFKAVGSSIGVALLPLGRLKAFITINVVWSILFFAISALTIPVLGIKGMLLAYACGYLFHILANYVYLSRTIGFAFSAGNLKLLACSLLLLGFMIFAYRAAWLYVVLLLALAGLWLAHAASVSEVRAFFAGARQWLQKRTQAK
jgi:O-antigen/teichoic acid export membrane protein